MTKKTDITLPPLPQSIVELDNCFPTTTSKVLTWGRAAVEADRRDYWATLKLARAIVNAHRRNNPPEDSVEADRQSQDQGATYVTGQRLPDGSYEAVPAAPSDEEILELWSGDSAHSRPIMGKDKVLTFARALLTRYGSSQPEETK